MSNLIKLPIDTIIKLYAEEHWSATKIAEHFNVSIGTILKYFKINGIPPKYPNQRHNPNSSHKIIFNKQTTAKIIHLYTIDHLASIEIGKQFNISFSTILNLLRENNIPIFDSRHDKKRMINKTLSIINPQIIRNINVNGSMGDVTCPTCGKTRRLTLSTPRIKEIQAHNGRCNHCASKSRIFKLNEPEIITLYTIEEIPIKYIANKYNVSNHVIERILKANNIKLRPKGYSHRLKINNKGTLESPVIGDTCRGIDIGLNDPTYYVRVLCPKCHQERWQCKSHTLRKHHLLCRKCALDPTLDNKGTIDSPVVGDVHPAKDIGKISKYNRYYQWVLCPECGVGRWEASTHVIKHPRCKDCACRIRGLNNRGKNCYLWKDGKSQEYPTDFNDRLKEQIRKRDNYTCQLCGKPQGNVKLAIHHIDYIKANLDQSNLISLCPLGVGTCHQKTNNHNREYWTQYFTNLLKTRGIIPQ